MDSYESGDFLCDIIISSDSRGIVQNEFLPENIAVKYVPYDMEDKLLPGNNGDLLALVGEAVILTYNETRYDAPPVRNWWELTEEQWRGMVYIPNPARSTTTLAFFSTVIENSDIMAQAYEDLYGVPPELPEGENAGREFIRRLVANDLAVVNSSDETAEQVGYPGSGSPALGIMISSKMRLRSMGYEMVNHYEMEPFCGVYVPGFISVAGGAKNVNAAKLFIRWALGEADGQGEGYRPFLQSGAWSVRSDVQDDSGVKPDELSLLYSDRRYLYENYDGTIAFWESLLTE
jgi:iron(III) transport system substrate-binding protein